MRLRYQISGQISKLDRYGEGRLWNRLTQFARGGACRYRQHGGRGNRRRSGLHRVAPALGILLAVSPMFASLATAQTVSPFAGVSSPRANPLPGGRPVVISLTEAVALALRNNRTIRSAYLERVAQKFDLVVVQARFRPQLNLAVDVFAERGDGAKIVQSAITPTLIWVTPTGASVQFRWDRRDRLNGGPAFSSDAATLSLVQPLLRGGGVSVNLAPVRIARLQEEINRLGLKSTVSTTVTNVVFGYRSLLQAQQEERLAGLSLERTRQLLVTNRALIDAGRLAAADIVQTEFDVANQQVAVLQAGQQKRSAQLALLFLLAVDPRTDVIAGDSIAADHIDVSADRLVALGFSGRMDVLAQRVALEQNRQALVVAKNDRLFDLSLVGSVDRLRGNYGQVGPVYGVTNGKVGLQLNIPIGNPAQRQGEIRAATNLRLAEVRYEDLCQSAETQIRDALQGVESNWLQLELAGRARSLAEQALDIQREKLKAGRASNFEVLSFQASLRAAETQQLAASIGYLNALTALDEQVGSTLDTWQIVLND